MFQSLKYLLYMKYEELYNQAMHGNADALDSLDEMAARGDYEAQYVLSCIYDNVGSPFQDINLGMHWLTTSAGYGYEPAMKKIKELPLRNKNEFRKKERVGYDGLFAYKGRIDRFSYASCILFCLLYRFLFRTQFEQFAPTWYSSIIESVIEIILTYLIIVSTIKRLHDCGYSGWWVFFPLCPILLLFVEGEETDNKFGERMK